MFIRPALDPASEIEGARLKVRDPETYEFLPDEGAEKPASEYWHRRLQEGGVEVCDPSESRAGFFEIGKSAEPANEESQP